jgi:hypothetical protein
MILGISLVVQELNKGPRLLFRYPEESSSYYHRAFQTAVESGNLSGPPIIKSKKITIPTVTDIASNDGLLHTSKSATLQNVDATPAAPVQRSTASIRLNQIYEQYFGLRYMNTIRNYPRFVLIFPYFSVMKILQNFFGLKMLYWGNSWILRSETCTLLASLALAH